jgi:hypothetical protein
MHLHKLFYLIILGFFLKFIRYRLIFLYLLLILDNYFIYL